MLNYAKRELALLQSNKEEAVDETPIHIKARTSIGNSKIISYVPAYLNSKDKQNLVEYTVPNNRNEERMTNMNAYSKVTREVTKYQIDTSLIREKDLISLKDKETGERANYIVVFVSENSINVNEGDYSKSFSAEYLETQVDIVHHIPSPQTPTPMNVQASPWWGRKV